VGLRVGISVREGEDRPRREGSAGDPSALFWLTAVVGMALPWVGAGLGLAGGWHLNRGNTSGWWLLGFGAAALLGDPLIDLLLARFASTTSDHPNLNRRAAQLLGRILIVAEAIEGGRGKVRVGDTLWPAEGPDSPEGGTVMVIGSSGTALLVERAVALKAPAD
jgi:inner membrane protein